MFGASDCGPLNGFSVFSSRTRRVPTGRCRAFIVMNAEDAPRFGPQADTQHAFTCIYDAFGLCIYKSHTFIKREIYGKGLETAQKFKLQTSKRNGTSLSS
jgi:hypothetical protein